MPIRNINNINPYGTLGTREKCNEQIFLARTTEDMLCTGNEGKCGKSVRKHYKPMQKRNEYMCKVCYSRIRLYSGTIFEATNLPVEYWFYALEEVFDSPLGITRKKLARRLKISKKTAGYMLRKIRMELGSLNPTKLEGFYLECDETFPKTGSGGYGKAAGEGSGNKERVTPVAVLACRETGKIVARVVYRVDAMLIEFIANHAKKGATILTDGNVVYKKLKEEEFKLFQVKHPSTNKRNGEWVLDIASTNRCENFNSFLKAMMRQYRSVPVKSIQAFVDELVYRFNHAHNEDEMMETFLNSLPQATVVDRKNFRGGRGL
jgi:hypothetical protein